jgi:hypothetical protein
MIVAIVGIAAAEQARVGYHAGPFLRNYSTLQDHD